MLVSNVVGIGFTTSANAVYKAVSVNRNVVRIYFAALALTINKVVVVSTLTAKYNHKNNNKCYYCNCNAGDNTDGLFVKRLLSFNFSLNFLFLGRLLFGSLFEFFVEILLFFAHFFSPL